MATSIDTLRVLLKVARTLTGRDYELETWNPGDVWTRYRLTENGGSTNTSAYMTKGECETWLRAFILGAEVALGREAVTDLFRSKGNPWEGSAASNRLPGYRAEKGES